MIIDSQEVKVGVQPPPVAPEVIASLKPDSSELDFDKAASGELHRLGQKPEGGLALCPTARCPSWAG